MENILLISQTLIAEIKQMTSTLKEERINPHILEAQRFDLQQALGYPLYNALIDAYRGATSPYSNENLFVNYGNLAVSAFQAGEIVKGMSGATEKARGVMVSDAAGRVELSTLTGTWDDAVTLLGVTSLTTATISTLTYGKYYLLLNGERYVDNLQYSVEYIGVKIALAYWAYARFIENQQVTVADFGIVEKTNDFSTSATEKKVAALVSQARSAASAAFKQVEKYLSDKNTSTLTYSLWQSFNSAPRSPQGFTMTTIDPERRRSSGGKRHPDSGFTSAINTGTHSLDITTIVDGVQYIIPQLSGKRVTLVQYENVVLTSAQYTLVGTTFTITEEDMQSGYIQAGKMLRIWYE